MSRKLPIGVSDFKKLRENDYYYVDKSLFIKEVIDRGAEVLLLPRPRRFGKTLNLSMLRYFFEEREDSLAHLFQGLKISQEASIMEHQITGILRIAKFKLNSLYLIPTQLTINN
jgi:hypothetical protein